MAKRLKARMRANGDCCRDRLRLRARDQRMDCCYRPDVMSCWRSSWNRSSIDHQSNALVDENGAVDDDENVTVNCEIVVTENASDRGDDHGYLARMMKQLLLQRRPLRLLMLDCSHRSQGSVFSI